MSPPSEELLHPERVAQHAEWLRRLAYTLVSDPGLAEDLSQDTMAIALSVAPPRGRLKSWLATILRNHAGRVGRRDILRVDAETNVAESRETSVAMAEVSRHHELMGRLLELPEGYREAIVLRFFEQASHGEIAERLGIAEATVRTRLTRGLSKLRERLEESHGSYGAVVWLWAAAGQRGEPPAELLPDGSTVLPAGGARAVVWPWAAMAGAVVLSVLTAWLGAADGGVEERTADGSGVLETPFVGPEVSLSSDSLASSERVGQQVVPRPLGESDGEAVVPAEGALPRARGLAVDLQGHPLVNFRLVYRHEGEVRRELRSDAEGAFTFPTRDWKGQVDAAEEGYVGIMSALLLGVDPGYDLTVVASPRRTLRGRVVDESGAPLPQAIASFRLARDFRPELGRILHNTTWREWRMLTDERGEFLFEDAPSFEGFLGAALPGRASGSLSLDEWDDIDHEFVLEPVEPRGAVAYGQVVDASGQGLSQAWVSCRNDTIQTGPEGQFQLDLGEDEVDTITVVYPGYLPVRVSTGAPDSELEIVLRKPSMVLSGRVVDSAGEPLEGIHVRILDQEYMSVAERGTDGVPYMAQRSFESLMSGQKRVAAETDGEGRFAIRGLQDRSYRLRMSDASLRIVMSPPLNPAESSQAPHELVFRDAAATGPFSLRMVDPEGRPVQGLVLRIGRNAPSDDDLRHAVWGPPFRSDAQGLVHLPELVREGGMMLASDTDPRFTQELWPLPAPPAEPSEVPEIVVRPQAYLQIDLDSAAWPDEYRLAVFDPRGRIQQLSLSYGLSQRIVSSGRVSAGLSPVYGIPYDAQRMILASRTGVLMERELELVPGQITSIQD